MGSSSSSVCVSFRDDADTVILRKDSNCSARTSVKDDTAVGTLMALCIKDNKQKWVGRLGEQLVTRSAPKAERDWLCRVSLATAGGVSPEREITKRELVESAVTLAFVMKNWNPELTKDKQLQFIVRPLPRVRVKPVHSEVRLRHTHTRRHVSTATSPHGRRIRGKCVCLLPRTKLVVKQRLPPSTIPRS